MKKMQDLFACMKYFLYFCRLIIARAYARATCET